MKEIKICPGCGGSEFSEFIKPVDYTVSRQRFTIKKCKECDLLVTSPQPDESEIGQYYASEEYISHTDKSAGLIDIAYKIARHFTIKAKVGLIKKLSPEINNILDYGCGTGDFLLGCKNEKWNVTGIEPSDRARALATEKLGPYVHPAFPSQTIVYQAITLWHVLEHVHNLEALLTKLKAILSADGLLYLAVPNPNTWESTQYREYWAAYDVPRHLWHFNRHAITKLAQKYGFEPAHVLPMKLDSYYVSLLSEKYKRGGTTVSGITNAVKTGFISNQKAKSTGEYSSLIYVFKHA